MKLNDPALLAAYMEQREMTGAKLARKSDITRQFVYQLLGGQRRRCSPERAAAIEEALGLIPGTIFTPVSGHTLSLTSTGAGETSAA